MARPRKNRLRSDEFGAYVDAFAAKQNAPKWPAAPTRGPFAFELVHTGSRRPSGRFGFHQAVPLEACSVADGGPGPNFHDAGAAPGLQELVKENPADAFGLAEFVDGVGWFLLHGVSVHSFAATKNTDNVSARGVIVPIHAGR